MTFLKLKRVCIPLGLACNFHCRYCFRDLGQHKIPTKLNKLMTDYLSWLKSSWCESVIMSGGEPLLYYDTIKEIFDIIDKDLHRKVMSNASLLTADKVEFFNSQRVEFMLSYDGVATKELRGQDVLDNPKILNLIKSLDSLTVMSVITNKNTDIMKNYEYIAEKLGTSNFHYIPYQVYYNGYCMDLIEGFNYNLFIKSFREFQGTVYQPVKGYSNNKPKEFPLINVDLHGFIHDKDSLTRFGTVLDTFDTIKANHDEFFKNNFCSTSDCSYKSLCNGYREHSSPHYCKCIKLLGGLD